MIKENEKKNNDLICVESNKKKSYYTSNRRAALAIGVYAPAIQTAIDHQETLKNYAGEEVRVSLVDGSDIPYKYIN